MTLPNKSPVSLQWHPPTVLLGPPVPCFPAIFPLLAIDSFINSSIILFIISIIFTDLASGILSLVAAQLTSHVSPSFSLFHHQKLSIQQRSLITEGGTVAGMSERKKMVLLHPQIIISSSPGHSKIKIKPKQDLNANVGWAIFGTGSAFAEYKISPNCCRQGGIQDHSEPVCS